MLDVFVFGPNTDFKSLTRPCCWEVTLSRPKTSNGIPTGDGVASFSMSGTTNRLAMSLAAAA